MAAVSPDTGRMEHARQAAGPRVAGAGTEAAASAASAAPGGRSGRSQPAGLLAALRRPLTSYYLILGITTLLLALGLVMVLSTSSVAQLAQGASPYSGFQHQLLGVVLGLPCMWLAARASPALFRAAAYPLMFVSVVGLLLVPLIGVKSGGAIRYLEIGPIPVQPSELAKLAFLLWGADLLARKEKLRQLDDWRHLLIPLLPGTGILCMIVLVLLILIVVAGYRFQRLNMFLHPQSNPMGPDMQPIQGKWAVGSGGLFGVGLGASKQKWGYVPNDTTDFIFAILGEELGLVGTLCVSLLYGGLAFAGLRIARRASD